jgi:hypothetical protein
MDELDTADSQTLREMQDGLENQYAYLRGTIQSRYVYYRSPAFDKAFKKAAIFCIKNKISSEEYAKAALDSLGDLRHKFFPDYFGSATANQAALTYKADMVIPVSTLYEHQKSMLYTQIKKLGKTPVEALSNPRLPFYAWFRILATVHPISEIVSEYQKTAKEEMTPEIIAFIRNNKLDLSRIL